MRVAPQQAGQRRRDQPAGDAARHVDAEPAGGLALAGLKRLIDVFHLGQQRAQPLEQLFAVGGQPHLPRGAVQQAHAQLRFQLLHGGGHRGARHLQRMGRPDKAAHFRHLYEYAVLIESVHLVDLLFLGAVSDKECSRMARLRASRCGGDIYPRRTYLVV